MKAALSHYKSPNCPFHILLLHSPASLIFTESGPMTNAHPSKVLPHITANRELQGLPAAGSGLAKHTSVIPQGLGRAHTRVPALGIHPSRAMPRVCRAWGTGPDAGAPALAGTCGRRGGGGTVGKLEQERCLMFCSLSD